MLTKVAGELPGLLTHGHDIFVENSNTKISAESLSMQSGGARMPDATNKTHSQNLNNPANKPFVELLQILTERFHSFLTNDNENDSAMFGYNEDTHMMMCLQLILAEAGEGEGERGFHQDMWATTGAAIIGVSLLNSRAVTMQHCGSRNTEATFPLPRHSAYVLSGAARYGTLWNGLTKEFKHHVHPFMKDTSSNEADGPSTSKRQRRI